MKARLASVERRPCGMAAGEGAPAVGSDRVGARRGPGASPQPTRREWSSTMQAPAPQTASPGACTTGPGTKDHVRAPSSVSNTPVAATARPCRPAMASFRSGGGGSCDGGTASQVDPRSEDRKGASWSLPVADTLWSFAKTSSPSAESICAPEISRGKAATARHSRLPPSIAKTAYSAVADARGEGA